MTEHQETPPIAAVVVERALDQSFDYTIPVALRQSLRVGDQVYVPFGRGRTKGYVIGLKEITDYRGELKAIDSLVIEKTLVTPEIMQLALWMSDYYIAPLSQVFKTVLPGAVRREGLKQKQRQFVTWVGGGRQTLTPKQAGALDVLKPYGEMLLSDLMAEAQVGRSVIAQLEKKEWVTVHRGAERRDPHANDTILPSLPLPCTPEQAGALEVIRQSIDIGDPGVVLLQGVTGSGKTEVYLQAIQHGMDQGKGAIVLVPEISLTPQTVERFRGRFGKEIAVLHSHLSDGERHDEWHRIRDGKVQLVVGARSALFAPVRNLGLIVVDEEHENSYKQSTSPQYHARDVAVMRGHLSACSVLLGSATPAMESMHNARLGKYAHCRMQKRVQEAKMPVVKVVDMTLEMNKNEGRPRIFSEDLMEAVYVRLNRAEQTILFLNRRGFATQMICLQCGHVEMCPCCSLALTFHRRRNHLRCHLCGFQKSPPAVCPAPQCGDQDFRMAGLGTEKIEAAIQKCFKHARIRRVDSDTMRSREAVTKVFSDFRSGRVDILVGTQMLAKGLHFPNVTLVGIINADSTLHMPDFRAAERTFQLVTQVAGRAGRGDVVGEVIVQTWSPMHPVIRTAQRQDVDAFVGMELQMRQQVGLPPFTHLANLLVRGPREQEVSEACERFMQAFRAQGPHRDVQIIGPAPCPIERIKNQYRYHVQFQAPKAKMIARPLRAALREHRWPSNVKVSADMDAMNLM